jgi:hypothetical protein
VGDTVRDGERHGGSRTLWHSSTLRSGVNSDVLSSILSTSLKVSGSSPSRNSSRSGEVLP